MQCKKKRIAWEAAKNEGLREKWKYLSALFPRKERMGNSIHFDTSCLRVKIARDSVRNPLFSFNRQAVRFLFTFGVVPFPKVFLGGQTFRSLTVDLSEIMREIGQLEQERIYLQNQNITCHFERIIQNNFNEIFVTGRKISLQFEFPTRRVGERGLPVLLCWSGKRLLGWLHSILYRKDMEARRRQGEEEERSIE